MAVPADHPGVHVVPGEATLTGHRFGVCGGELVVREHQVAAAALDVESGSDAAQRNCGALDVPTGTAGTEGRRPGRLTGALGPPHQRIQRVRLTRAVGVTAAFGEQRQHRLAIEPGLVAELRGGVGAEVHVRVAGSSTT